MKRFKIGYSVNHPCSIVKKIVDGQVKGKRQINRMCSQGNQHLEKPNTKNCDLKSKFSHEDTKEKPSNIVNAVKKATIRTKPPGMKGYSF